MRICPQCSSRFVGGAERCPIDGTPLQEAPDPLLGTLLGGRYRILARIAEGGMAVVYKARQDPLDRIVAVKVLSEGLSSDPSQKERFLREARAANRIHHEAVIDVTDFGETPDGLVYLVMEYLEGQSLGERMQGGPIPLPHAIEILRPVCRGLQRAHELGILHRDLKPENIFLEKRDDGGSNIKILDFGLAQILGDKRLTSAGQVFGTPEYLSPEQGMGGEVTAAADLYALGVVFFEMVTGELPFKGATAKLIYHHINTAPAAPSKVRPGLPPELDGVVLRLLAKHPAERFESARALEDALAGLSRQIEAQDRMATASTVRGSTTELIAFPPDTVDAFRKKVEVCRQAWLRRPADNADPNLGTEIGTVSAAIEDLERKRVAMTQAAREYKEYVEHGRATLERLRKASAELEADERRLRREVQTVRTALAQSHGTLDEAGREFQEARSNVAAADAGADGPATAEKAMAYENAGRSAKRWRDLSAEIDELDREAALKTEEMEEVRFQLGQFRGRIAAYEVDIRESGGALPPEAQAHQRRMNDAHRAFIVTVEKVAVAVNVLEKKIRV